MVFRRERNIQMPDRAIQPQRSLLFLGCKNLPYSFLPFFSGRYKAGDSFNALTGIRIGNSDFKFHKAAGFVRRLADMRAEKVTAINLKMLMACQQNIIPELAAHFPPLVFIGMENLLPGRNIVFKSTVIDADRDIRTRCNQGIIRFRRRVKSIPHRYASEVFRGLPLGNKVACYTRKADAQPVFHRNDSCFLYAADPLYIGTEAAGIQLCKILLNLPDTEIEVMIAECDKPIPCGIHHLSRKIISHISTLLIITGKGASLQRISTVDDQSILSAHKKACAITQAGCVFFSRRVVKIREKAVNIAGIRYCKRAIMHHAQAFSGFW